MAGVGPWPGAGRGKGEKYALPQASERAGVGNFARGPCFMGPRRPRNEHYLSYNIVLMFLKRGSHKEVS